MLLFLGNAKKGLFEELQVNFLGGSQLKIRFAVAARDLENALRRSRVRPRAFSITINYGNTTALFHGVGLTLLPGKPVPPAIGFCGPSYGQKRVARGRRAHRGRPGMTI